MTNPGFTLASADPAEHPELTFIGPEPTVQLPPGCPPLDPGQLATPGVTISPDADPATATGGMVVISADDLPEPVAIDPEEGSGA